MSIYWIDVAKRRIFTAALGQGPRDAAGGWPMTDTIEALILDLLEWVAGDERSYAEVMEAWRTSCPRLPVWEDAIDRGLITRRRADGRALVAITQSGLALLARSRQSRGAKASMAEPSGTVRPT